MGTGRPPAGCRRSPGCSRLRPRPSARSKPASACVRAWAPRAGCARHRLGLNEHGEGQHERREGNQDYQGHRQGDAPLVSKGGDRARRSSPARSGLREVVPDSRAVTLAQIERCDSPQLQAARVPAACVAPAVLVWSRPCCRCRGHASLNSKRPLSSVRNTHCSSAFGLFGAPLRNSCTRTVDPPAHTNRPCTPLQPASRPQGESGAAAPGSAGPARTPAP